MLGIKVDLKSAEYVLKLLKEKGILEEGYKPIRLGNAVVFPIKKWSSFLTKYGEPFSAQFPYVGRFKSLKDILKKYGIDGKRAFDLIGDVAIVEIDQDMWDKKGIIGEAIASIHNVKAVYAKKSGMKGIYRVRELSLIWGEDRDKTLYRESGVEMVVPFKEVFFSPRLSFERRRIASLVGKERVLVMFAGIGPFALVIAKHSNAEEVVGVEINPKAVEAFKENIRRNKLSNVRAILSDVVDFNECCFDRIVMPLPKDGERYLSHALELIKDKGVIHFYSFVNRKRGLEELIEKVLKNSTYNIEPLFWRKVRDYSPDVFQMVLDFRVWK